MLFSVGHDGSRQVTPWLLSANESLKASSVFERPGVDSWLASGSWGKFEEYAPLKAFLTHATHLSKECIALKVPNETAGTSATALSTVDKLKEAADAAKDWLC